MHTTNARNNLLPNFTKLKLTVGRCDVEERVDAHRASGRGSGRSRSAQVIRLVLFGSVADRCEPTCSSDKFLRDKENRERTLREVSSFGVTKVAASLSL